MVMNVEILNIIQMDLDKTKFFELKVLFKETINF